MGGFPYWGVNPGFPWFLLIMPVMFIAMMFFFCRIGFCRDQRRASACWSRSNHYNGLVDEVAALRKEVDALKRMVVK